MSKLKDKIKNLFKFIGPGVITGAADDDPSGIVTYTQAGAQFGYGQLWTAFLTLPFLIAIQEVCARIGAVTGKGIAAVIKEHYNRKILYFTIFLVLIANTINIGADLGAMGAAAHLIIPLNISLLILFFTLLILILEIFTSYKVYANILKWFALALFSYVITLFLVHEPWGTILKATFIPHVQISFPFLFIITGVIGTTISPYMFFWEANEEVEEEKEKKLINQDKPIVTSKSMQALRIDNGIGMIASQIATWCMIVVAATVLHANGITNIATAADAAKALVPLVHTFPNAGFLAEFVFAFGVIILGLLAVPVMSASAAYSCAEALNWSEGLNFKLKRAHGFYGIITIATIVGLMINFIGINPIKALIFTAVFNGVAAVPLIFIIARVGQNKKIMGDYASSTLSNIFVWSTCILMAAAAVGIFLTL